MQVDGANHFFTKICLKNGNGTTQDMMVPW